MKKKLMPKDHYYKKVDDNNNVIDISVSRDDLNDDDLVEITKSEYSIYHDMMMESHCEPGDIITDDDLIYIKASDHNDPMTHTLLITTKDDYDENNDMIKQNLEGLDYEYITREEYLEISKTFDDIRISTF